MITSLDIWPLEILRGSPLVGVPALGVRSPEYTTIPRDSQPRYPSSMARSKMPKAAA